MASTALLLLLTWCCTEWLNTTNWSSLYILHERWLTKSLFFSGIGHFTIVVNKDIEWYTYRYDHISVEELELNWHYFHLNDISVSVQIKHYSAKSSTHWMISLLSTLKFLGWLKASQQASLDYSSHQNMCTHMQHLQPGWLIWQNIC